MKGFIISCVITFALLYLGFYFVNRASQKAHMEYSAELEQKEAKASKRKR